MSAISGASSAMSQTMVIGPPPGPVLSGGTGSAGALVSTALAAATVSSMLSSAALFAFDSSTAALNSNLLSILA